MSTLNVVELTGAGNFEVPAGVYYLEYIDGVGSTAGGGRGVSLAFGGGASPGSAAARRRRFAVIPGDLIPYSVGVAGVGSLGTGGSATAGDHTTFGAAGVILKASGGTTIPNNNSTAVTAAPTAASCIGDVTVGGSVGTANSGGNGGHGGPGPNLAAALSADDYPTLIVPGVGGLTGAQFAAAGGSPTGIGGPADADGGGAGGGRNINNRGGGNGIDGRLYVAWLLPEVWS